MKNYKLITYHGEDIIPICVIPETSSEQTIKDIILPGIKQWEVPGDTIEVERDEDRYIPVFDGERIEEHFFIVTTIPYIE